VPLQVRRSNCV